MKNVYATFLIAILLTGLVPEARSQSTHAPSMFSLDEILSEQHSPKDLAKWMRHEFKFVNDRDLFGAEDYWQTPQEFWESRAGDCEDFALFAQYGLKRIGLESYVVSLYGDQNYAHTITVFNDGKGYNVMNESNLLNFHARSIEDALTFVNPAWTWAAIAERRDSRGWLVRKIEKQ